MIMRQPLVVAVVVAAAGALAAAPAGDVTSPVRISGSSPFSADCNGAAFPGGAAYVNAEVEPYVAVNPRNPNNLIAVYQQDRYPDDGANGVLAATSFDGGRSWQRPGLESQPEFSRCAGGNESNGGDFELASDPWVDFGSDGTAYFAALGFNKSNPGTAEFVSVSTTGGRSWQRAVAVIRESAPNLSDERPAVTADPTRAHTAYLVWDRHQTAPAAEARGAVYFSRTVDGGKHWSAPRAIYRTPLGMETSANQIVVTPDGELVNVFNELGLDTGSHHPRHDRIAVIRSADGGSSWSEPATLATSAVTGVSDPRTGQEIRAGDSFTHITVDPRAGVRTLYAVWADSRFTNGRVQQIVLARSDDGGGSWSEPAAVTIDRQAPAFVPGVAVNNRGEVAVTYYGLAPGTAPSRALLADYWIAVSTDRGQTWMPPRQLTQRPFDLRTAPYNGGFFFGEYQGLAAMGARFIAVAALANERSLDNRTDIYSMTITTADHTGNHGDREQPAPQR
jgi:BNR repeat-like domain